MAQAAAVDTYTKFSIYQSDGDISRYWDGIASFHTFQQAYRSAFQGTNQAANYHICNEVYGYLIAHPEKSQNYVVDIISIMELLSKDMENTDGHTQMSKLNKALKE